MVQETVCLFEWPMEAYSCAVCSWLPNQQEVDSLKISYDTNKKRRPCDLTTEMTVGVQSCRCHPHANGNVLCEIGIIHAVSDRLCWTLFGGLQGKRLIYVCSSESGRKWTNHRNPIEVANETED